MDPTTITVGAPPVGDTASGRKGGYVQMPTDLPLEEVRITALSRDPDGTLVMHIDVWDRVTKSYRPHGPVRWEDA